MQIDLAVDLQGLARSALMTMATGAPRRVGFANAREFAALAYTDRIQVPTLEMAAPDRYWHIVSAWGGSVEPLPSKLGISTLQRQWARKKLAALPRPLLGIHPGATSPTKRLPPETFVQLGRWAMKKYGGGIVLFGGPDETALCADIARSLAGPVLNLGGSTTLLQLAAALEESDLLLSGDTGPMHLAAAVGTRVVSVFTCTSPVRARPYGSGHRVVATEVDCAGSYLRKCSVLKCMSDMAPLKIWPSLDATLDESKESRTEGAA